MTTFPACVPSSSRAPVDPIAGDCGSSPQARSTISVALGAAALCALDDSARALACAVREEPGAFAAGLRDAEARSAFAPLPGWSPELLAEILHRNDRAAMGAFLSYAAGFHRAGGSIFRKATEARHAL